MKKIKCEHCGTAVQARIKSKKYCSKRCSDAARSKRLRAKKPGALFPRSCDECGLTFQPKNGGQRYCSSECKYVVDKRRQQEVKRANRQSRCCPICTGFFYPKSGVHKYCSDGCRDAAEKQQKELKRQMRRAARLPADEADWTPPKLGQIRRRRCVVCEDFFRPKASQQKTCSTSCRNEHRANVNRRCAKDKKEERALAAEAFELLTARLERKKEVKTEITGETNYSVEIGSFLAKGGKVQVYPVIWSPDVFNSMPEEIF